LEELGTDLKIRDHWKLKDSLRVCGIEQSGTAYKNDMCTEHGNEKTCSEKSRNFLTGSENEFYKILVVKVNVTLAGRQTDRHNEANTGLRSFSPNLHIKSG